MESKDNKLEEKTNEDYKDLFGRLRNTINTSRDSYQKALASIKDSIEQKEEELKILRIRKHKLEGAIEVSDAFLTAVLPSNNKD